MDYLDFAVEISESVGLYRIRADSPFMAPAESAFALPYSERDLDAVLDRVELAILKGSGRRRTLRSSQLDTLRAFGTALFESLITGEVEEAYYDAYRRASEQRVGLRIRLTIEPGELAGLPWELLFDSRQGDFVCLSSSTPLVRDLRTPNPAPPLEVTGPLRILGMTSSPQGLAPLDITAEKERAEAALAPLVARGAVDIGWVEAGTWRALQNALLDGPWHIFHYIGHGAFEPSRGEGILAFEHEAGGGYRAVSPTELGRLIDRDHALRLVVLNACEGARGDERDTLSSAAAHLVHRSVPAVLAMQWEISDDAAIEFARTFYHSIAQGSPVDAAVADSRLAVSMAVEESVEWATPVLYMRTNDGKLFDLHVDAQPVGAGDDRATVSADGGKEPAPDLSRRTWSVVALAGLALVVIIALVVWGIGRGGDGDDGESTEVAAVCPNPADPDFTLLELSSDLTGASFEDDGDGPFLIEVTNAAYRPLQSGTWEVVLATTMTNEYTEADYHGYWRYDGLTVDGRRYDITCFGPVPLVDPGDKSDATIGFEVEHDPDGELELKLSGGDRIEVSSTQ